MPPDETIEEVLRLARARALSDDALRDAVGAVIERLAPEQRDAAIALARSIIAEQRLH